MLFTVIGPDGKPKMGTDCRECIYGIDQLESMSSAGCKFKWNDKIISLVNLKKELSNSNEIRNISKPLSGKTLIVCLETNQQFEKQSEAAKTLGIDPAAVSDSLKTGRKRAGYTFTRVEV